MVEKNTEQYERPSGVKPNAFWVDSCRRGDLIEPIMTGLCPGFYQNTFKWQPGHVKMRSGSLDYSSLCLTTHPGLPANASWPNDNNPS